MTSEAGARTAASCRRDVAKSSSLRSFEFPFVAYAKNGYVKVWGRTKDGASHQVVIQRKLKTGWTTVKTLIADTYGIFALRWRSSDRRTSTGRKPVARTRSAFSLRRPRSFSLPNTWGCGGPFKCRH